MSYPTPLKSTAHLTCPGCWANTLAETVAPSKNPLMAGVAWFQCTDKECNWVGSTKDLRERTMGHGEIRACMREDQQRGEPGSSGSGGKGPKKKVNAHKGFQPRNHWDTGESSKTQHIGPPKSKGVRWGKFTFWVTAQEWDLLLRVAGGNYPAGLRPHVERVLCGVEPVSADQVKDAFSQIVVEFLSRTS